MTRFRPVSEWLLWIVWSWPKVFALDSKGRTEPLVPIAVVAAAVNATPLVLRQVIAPLATSVQSPDRFSGAYTDPVCPTRI